MKTAEELGITEVELKALKTVREGLASGLYTHIEEFNRESATGPSFNMDVDCAEGSCGTCACIGGWMAIEQGLKGEAAANYVHERGDKLHALFFPKALDDWDAITPEHAVKAIDNFLDTGSPKWDEVAPDLIEIA